MLTCRRYFGVGAFLYVGTASIGLPGSLLAQDSQVCPDGRIESVYIDDHSVFDTQEMGDAWYNWALDVVNWLHPDTKRSFIRSELLFEEGDCFDAVLLEESERVLRNYDFLARVDVRDEERGNGSHVVYVETHDEWSTQVDLGLDLEEDLAFERVEVTEENLAGFGIYTSLFYAEGADHRDFGLRVQTPRIFSSRTNAHIELSRTRSQTFVSQGFSYPFVGEIGRFAGQQAYFSREILFPYAIAHDESDTHVILPFERNALETTGAIRFGGPGNLLVAGLGLLYESTRFSGFPGSVEVVPNGDQLEAEPAGDSVAGPLDPQARPSDALKANLLLGYRNLDFVQATGLDALTAVEDLPIGTEISITFSRPFSDGSSDPRGIVDDLHLRFSGYAGLATESWYVAVNAILEGGVLFLDPEAGGNDLRDVLADADLYAYWKTGQDARHTLFARISGAGGWSVGHPFQLTLGGESRIRSYERMAAPGGRRLIATLEDRIYLRWPAPELFDFGVTVFGDVGKMWGGDVPFGATSAVHAAIGTGIRVGIPAGTRGVVRADIAFPVAGPESWSSPVFRVTVRESVGLVRGFGDHQMARSQRYAVGTDLLTERVR